MNCIIVASGTLAYTPVIKTLLHGADLIIAADGGANHLKAMNIQPHIIIGDMDSILPSEKRFFEKNHIPFITHPSRKDNTDTDLCIDSALEKGATYITLIGVTGQRLDHTLANIFLLKRISDLGIGARIVDETNEIYLVTNYLELIGEPGELLSVIPISDNVTGLSLKGLEYPIENASISMGSSLGISNCFKDTFATISVKTGTVLVTKSRE